MTAPRYISRRQDCGDGAYEVLNLGDDRQAILAGIPATVIIDVVIALNRAYAEGKTDHAPGENASEPGTFSVGQQVTWTGGENHFQRFVTIHTVRKSRPFLFIEDPGEPAIVYDIADPLTGSIVYGVTAGQLRAGSLPDLMWAPYQESGIPDRAAGTPEPPAHPIRIGSVGYQDGNITIYWIKTI